MLPFAAPPAGLTMSPDPSMEIGLDPQLLMRMLTDMAPQEFKPKIPHWYKAEKKPTGLSIWEGGLRVEARGTQRVNRMMETIRRLRFDMLGVFDSDQAARDLGEQDEWVASDLVDDWNLLCAILGSMDRGFVKGTLQRANQVSAQTMEDAAQLWFEEMEYRWANTGDMPLAMAQAKVITSYGEIMWRVLCDTNDPDFPFDVRLVDPASVHVTPGGIHGPKRIHRMMRMMASEAYAEWGEPKKEGRKQIEDKVGSDDATVITVCEYADCTYRAAVTLGGVELLPIVEHKYYSVPFVIQGGPAGEPLFTDTERASADIGARLGGGWWRSGPADDWGMQHKLVSSIHLQRKRHDQLEAFMARVVTSVQDATDPALMVMRDTLAGGMPLPKIDRRRGRETELNLGDTVQPIPVVMNPQDVNLIMGQITQNQQTGGIPLGMYGSQPGSNITGNSMSVAAESGMDHITPWISSLETGMTRVTERMFMYWRNKGHLSQYRDGKKYDFMVPVSKPTTSQELGRALTPEIIDALGPRVKVVMSRLRVQEAMQWAQVAGQLIPMGVTTRRRMAEKMGHQDYDRLRAEWQEEADWDAMNADETLMKEVRIPMKLKQLADEALNDEERAMYMALLDRYMETRAIEAQAMAAQAAAPPGLPAGGGPPPPGGGPIGPGGGPASNTLNFAGMGAAPGSAGSPVGRPPGPFGPPGI